MKRIFIILLTYNVLYAIQTQRPITITNETHHAIIIDGYHIHGRSFIRTSTFCLAPGQRCVKYIPIVPESTHQYSFTCLTPHQVKRFCLKDTFDGFFDISDAE